MAIYDRDYLTTLPLLYEKASEYSGGDWNKYNDDVGDTLLKLLASASHTVDYYFRKFLTSLILPNDDWNQKSLIWELTGYKPNYLRADYLMVQLYWPDCGLDSYVPIYQYTPFKITADEKEYVFLCAQDYILPPFTTRANIRLVNGELKTISLKYTDVKNNKVKLSDYDIDYDLITLLVSGTKWKQVRNVFYSPDIERIYSVHKEEDGTYLYLHSSWKTYVDSYDPSFVVYYVQSIYDFSVYTDECMSVEFDAELLTVDGDDVSEFYRIIPLLNSEEAMDAANLMPSTTEGNRAITLLDFAQNVLLFPGIVSCSAYDWNTPSVTTNPFEIVLIACDSKGHLSEHMIMVLKDYIESISSALLTIRILEPRLVKQDLFVILDIGDYRGTVAEAEIKRVVEASLSEFYEIGNLMPGRVVSTRELNSLLLHADSRINFATVTFKGPVVDDPFSIPILGAVTILTSAEAFNYYDYAIGHDDQNHAKIELWRYIWPDAKEKLDGISLFFAFTLKVNILSPVDKLPMPLFDSAKASESKPIFHIGSHDFPVSEFSYGEDYVHVAMSGGADNDIRFNFVFETDGTTVFAKTDREIQTKVLAELKFTNSFGIFYIDPDIRSIEVYNDNIPEIKDALAEKFNQIPHLVNAQGQPFDITGSDIYYPGDVSLGGSLDKVSHVYPKNDSDSLLMGSDEMHGNSSENEENDSKIQNNDTVEPFIYIPYEKENLNKGTILRGDGDSESEHGQLDQFVVSTITTHNYQTYFGFHYASKGRYELDPNAYGDMEYNAQTTLSITDRTYEYIPSGPELYTETAKYLESYYIREINGNQLHWYFVNTSMVHTVGGIHEIGYGIYVRFNLAHDSALYVIADTQTSRGFIYSAEMEAADFMVSDI